MQRTGGGRKVPLPQTDRPPRGWGPGPGKQTRGHLRSGAQGFMPRHSGSPPCPQSRRWQGGPPRGAHCERFGSLKGRCTRWHSTFKAKPVWCTKGQRFRYWNPTCLGIKSHWGQRLAHLFPGPQNHHRPEESPFLGVKATDRDQSPTGWPLLLRDS